MWTFIPILFIHSISLSIQFGPSLLGHLVQQTHEEDVTTYSLFEVTGSFVIHNLETITYILLNKIIFSQERWGISKNLHSTAPTVTSRWRWRRRRLSTTRAGSSGSRRRFISLPARSTSNIFPSTSRHAWWNSARGLTTASRWEPPDISRMLWKSIFFLPSKRVTNQFNRCRETICLYSRVKKRIDDSLYIQRETLYRTWKCTVAKDIYIVFYFRWSFFFTNRKSDDKYLNPGSRKTFSYVFFLDDLFN